jgi:hypothetical protein
LKKEFLKAYELSDEVIDTIMAEAAKDVSKYADYDELKKKLEAVKDYDDVKASVAEWEKKYADKESELTGVKFSHALTDGLKAAGAKNIKATKALLDETTLKLDKDGNLVGLDEQLKAIKADNAFLFASEKAEMTPIANVKTADVSTAMSVNKAREIMGLKPAKE